MAENQGESTDTKSYEEKLALTTQALSKARGEAESQKKLISELEEKYKLLDTEKSMIARENKVLQTEIEIRNAKIKLVEESEQEAKSQDKANLVRQQVLKVNEKVQEVKEDNIKYKKENSELKDAIFKANIKKDSLILQVQKLEAENKEVSSLKAANAVLKEELAQAEAGIKSLQKDNSNLLNQIESVRTEKFQQDVDMKSMQEKYEKYLQEKDQLKEDQEKFRKAQLEVEAHLNEHREKYLQLQRDFEATRKVEQEKINTLQQENTLLRDKADQAIKERENTQKELLEMLKTSSVNKTEQRQHSIYQAMSQVSELKKEIFELQLVLVQEQKKTKDKERLAQCLKSDLEDSLDENKRLQENIARERERLYSKKAQIFCYNKFKELLKSHSEICEHKEKCCFDSKIKELEPTEQEIIFKKVDFSEQLESSIPCTPSKPPSKSLTQVLEEHLASLDSEIKPEGLDYAQYAESVCSNHKLAREIRETLQILLMKEKNEIDHIKEKSEMLDVSLCPNCKGSVPENNDATMEDESSDKKFLEEQVESLISLKDMLQSQLEEEYQLNSQQKREIKDLGDELMEYKEKHFNTLLQLNTLKAKFDKLENIQTWLCDTTKRIIDSNINNIRARKQIESMVEEATKSVLENSMKNHQMKKDDWESTVKLESKIESLEAQVEALEEKHLKMQLKAENGIRLRDQAKNELSYFYSFCQKIRKLVYGLEEEEDGKVAVNTLDTIYASVADKFYYMKRQIQNPNGLYTKHQETLTTRDLLSDVVKEEAKKLQASQLSPSDIESTEQFQRLKETIEKDKESYEGEIRALKQQIADSQAQKDKDSAFMNRLKRDNITLFKQNKEYKQLKEGNEETKKALGELTQERDKLAKEQQESVQKLTDAEGEKQELTKQLDQAKADLKTAQDNLSKAQDEIKESELKKNEVQSEKANIEEQHLKIKYDEIIEQLKSEVSTLTTQLESKTAELSSARAQIQDLESQIDTFKVKLEAEMKKEPPKNNTMKNLVKAFNLIKKSKKILDIVKERHEVNKPQVTPPVKKPSPSVIVKKRQAKADDKEQGDTKKQKTDE